MRYLLITLFCMLLALPCYADQKLTILTEETHIGKAEVRLPSVNGSADEENEKLINSAIKAEVEEMAKKVGANGTVTYDVLLNRPSLLSVLITAEKDGNYSYKGLNLDMTTGKVFEVSDFFMPNEGFKAVLGDSKDILFAENGLYRRAKKNGPYNEFKPYEELLPYMRIGEIGRLMQIARLTEKANGKVVKLAGPGLMAVKLPSNPSTGFKWILADNAVNKNKISIVGSSFIIPHSDRPVPGTPGTEILMLAAMEAGIYEVKLEYRRPWEKISVERISFKVAVE